MGIAIHPSNKARYELITSSPTQIEGEQMPRVLVDAVEGLWADPGVQSAYKRRNELQINDSAP